MNEMKTIGVVLNDGSRMGFNHSFFSEILEAFKLVAEEQGYTLLFLSNKEVHINHMTYVEQIKAAGCAGCFVVCKEGDEEVDALRASGIPMAVIDEDYDDVICVSSDNAKGMELLTEYVIEMGHKKIAIILGDDNTVTDVRFNAFLRVCENHGITVPEEYICRGKYRDIIQTIYLTESLLKMKDVPSAIMFSDDFSAIGGMNIISARALVIGKDISITGYDSNEVLSRLDPRLTTVRQDCVGMGQIAAEKLFAQIENPEVSQAGKYIVGVELEKGYTVGRVYI